MRNLTNNQEKAMKIFEREFINNSDFTGENPENPSECVFIYELLDELVAEGWTIKSAEGTVGSLCETGYMEYTVARGLFGHKEDLWTVFSKDQSENVKSMEQA